MNRPPTAFALSALPAPPAVVLRALRSLGAAAAVLALAAGAAFLPARSALAAPPVASGPAALKAVVAEAAPGTAVLAYDGVVEAVRQTTIAAQVAGSVVRLAVKAGDRVVAGQLLVQIDERAAAQAAEAGAAQVRAARAALDVAGKELERQRALHAERFISAAALDRAEAEFRAAQAQAAAQLAQADAARTQTGWYAVRAPYAGVVSEVPVMPGDMALPGRPLLTLYDPGSLRVSAAVPQSMAARLAAAMAMAIARIEVPALPKDQRMLAPVKLQLLPAADAATHTVTVRADLAPRTEGRGGTPAVAAALVPGQFARLWLPAPGAASEGTKSDIAPSPWVPAAAVVRRAEMTGLYVLDGQGRPLLRQVRLGRSDGERIEVLAGLAAGERVAVEPQVAARLVAAAR